MKKINASQRQDGAEDGPAVSRQTFRQEIREYMENAIYKGVLKPGERIRETYWAKQFGVSQAPIREAIRDLEAIGLVETKPYCGSTVRQLTDKDIIDSFSVRSCLEELAIKASIKQLKPDCIERMKAQLAAMHEASIDNDLKRFITHDEKFHELIIMQSGNAMLLRLWKQCNIRDWTNISAIAVGLSIPVMADMHKDVLDAILSGKEKIATKAIHDHLEVFSHQLLRSKSAAEQSES